MITLPQIFLVPTVDAAIVGPLLWPAMGAVLAWLVVLVLLAICVGVLRAQARRPAASHGYRSRIWPDIPLHAHQTQHKAA